MALAIPGDVDHADVPEDILEQLRGNDPDLKVASFRGKSLAEDMVQQVASALAKNTFIESLDLSHNNIGGASAFALAEAVKHNTSLRELILANNNFSIDGARALTAALSENTTLQTLDFSSNFLGDQGVRSLTVGLLKNKTLQTLVLQGNNFGPDGARALVELLEENHTLQIVDMTANDSIFQQPSENLKAKLAFLGIDNPLSLIFDRANLPPQVGWGEPPAAREAPAAAVKSTQPPSLHRKAATASEGPHPKGLFFKRTLRDRPQGIRWFTKSKYAWRSRRGRFVLSPALDKELTWEAVPKSLPNAAAVPVGDTAEGVLMADLDAGGKHAQRMKQSVNQLLKEGGRAGAETARIKVQRLQLIKNQNVLNIFNGIIHTLHERQSPDAGIDLASLPDGAEKLDLLRQLEPLFLHCKWVSSGQRGARVLLAWHGCSPEAAHGAILHGLADDYRVRDGGYFGAGTCLTPEAEYASMYSTNELGGQAPIPDKKYVMLLCAAVVARTYPITRGTDYVRDDNNTRDISTFHYAYPAKSAEEERTKRQDKQLRAGFDSHFVGIKMDKQYQAVEKGDVADYHELILPGSHVMPLVRVEFTVQS